MEQKQLDETFEGEEFIDDLEEIRVEPAQGRAKKVREAKAAKKAKAEKHPAEEKSREATPTAESRPIVDPWAEEKSGKGGEEAGFLSDASTWKAITGIMLVLLILSVFTQGFRFSGKGGLTGAATVTVSLQDAEKTAADFVNTNLLRPPFTAEVASSADAGNLYQVTLSVAGQTVDSYVTKDGKLFFPQGFDTTKSLQEQLTPAESSPEQQAESAEGGKVQVVPEIAEAGAAEPAAENVILVPVRAKKWLFQPKSITVKRGDTVQLMITPESGFQFTFALPDFGVGQEIIGPTALEFTADKTGKFPFLCSSCEEFRGMKGMLVVE